MAQLAHPRGPGPRGGHVPPARPPPGWRPAVTIGEDTVIGPGVSLVGRHRRGRRREIGPHTTVTDSRIGDGTSVVHSYLVEADVGDERERRSRSPTCVRAPSCARGRRSAPSWRSRTRMWARARRCPTCPTSAMPTWARAATSAPARSPPTTTAAASTGPGRKEREDGHPHVARGPGRRRGSGVHWCRFGDHRTTSPRAPSESPGQSRRTSRVTRTAMEEKDAADEHGPRHCTAEPAPGTSIPAGYEKRLMITAGRASLELGGKIAEPARRGARPTPASRRSPTARSTAATASRSAAPTCSSSSRSAARARGPHRQRRAVELLLMVHAAKHASAHRIIAVSPVVRLLAPGQEVRPARAHLRAPRGRACSRRPASTAW